MEQHADGYAGSAVASQELAMLFQGDENTRTLLTRLFNGELSYQDLAVPFKVDRSTAWRWVQEYLDARRHVKAAALALARFRQHEAFVINVCMGRQVPIRSTEQFAVALPGRKRSFRSEPTLKDIRSFLRRHARVLHPDTSPACFFSGWVSDGYHLAITAIFSNHADVNARGAQNEHHYGQCIVQQLT